MSVKVWGIGGGREAVKVWLRTRELNERLVEDC